MNKRGATLLNLLLFLLVSAVLTSCFAPTPVAPEPPGEKEPDPAPADTIGTVPPDGILETVTWNLEWYGHNFGPENETKQTKNFLTIIDTLNADLFAFQEVESEQSLGRLTSRMRGYRGFVAKNMGGSQKTAFVFNTRTIVSVSSGLITENQSAFDWAGGRYSFYFKFKYHYKNDTTMIYAVVIHAKAQTGGSPAEAQEDYRRRKDAAQSLYEYLNRNKPNSNIIFLGDYNDDVDESIYQGKVSPYQPFVTDSTHYRVVTKSLSKNGVSTTVSYDDAIDHITVSNELFDNYIVGSEEALVKWTDMIENYGQTTSDHYPVWAKFDFR